ncbi:MAG: LemA family protein [Bacilli bacterium]|nr:LemA family protein [Bacilli bacterium]
MNIVYIILIVLTVLFFIFLFFDITLYKLKYYASKISLVEEKIDTILNRKYENIIKIHDIIKDKIGTEKEIIDDISSLKDEGKSKSEIDSVLVDSLGKIEYIKEQYDELDDEEELNNLFNDIKKDDESLNAYKKFYNDNVNDYNLLVSKFPYVITAKLFKHKPKEFFDDTNIEE